MCYKWGKDRRSKWESSLLFNHSTKSFRVLQTTFFFSLLLVLVLLWNFFFSSLEWTHGKRDRSWQPLKNVKPDKPEFLRLVLITKKGITHPPLFFFFFSNPITGISRWLVIFRLNIWVWMVFFFLYLKI